MVKIYSPATTFECINSIVERADMHLIDCFLDNESQVLELYSMGAGELVITYAVGSVEIVGNFSINDEFKTFVHSILGLLNVNLFKSEFILEPLEENPTRLNIHAVYRNSIIAFED